MENNIDQLREELNMIELEDRLEMINLLSVDAVEPVASNGVCCCS